MDSVEKIAFLVKNPIQISECLRCAVGLGVDNRLIGFFIISAGIPLEDLDEVFLDRLEMIDDLEGETFTDVRDNAGLSEFIKYMSLEGMAERLKEYDLVIPF